MHYERAPEHQKEAWVPAKDSGGFAPGPPGFNALAPLPIGMLRTNSERGMPSHPPEFTAGGRELHGLRWLLQG
jgi:hypothetical protein